MAGEGEQAAQTVHIKVSGAEAAAAAPAARTEDGTDFRAMTPEQFKARIEEAKLAGERRALKYFGIEKDARPAFYERVKAGEFVLAGKPAEGEPDYKAEYQKAEPTRKELAAAKQKLDARAEYFKHASAAAFEQLDAKAQQYIVKRAGDDPEQRLLEIMALRDSGLLPGAPATPAGAEKAKDETAPPAEPEAPRPAATTIGPTGPGTKPAPSDSKSKLKQYQDMMAKGATAAAAMFRRGHRYEIEAEEQRQGK